MLYDAKFSKSGLLTCWNEYSKVIRYFKAHMFAFLFWKIVKAPINVPPRVLVKFFDNVYEALQYYSQEHHRKKSIIFSSDQSQVSVSQ